MRRLLGRARRWAGRGRSAEPGAVDERDLALLPAIARAGLQSAYGRGAEPRSEDPWLLAPGATFVTLREEDGSLRGCVGSLEATRPLLEDLVANARAAALEDRRFPPLPADRVDRVSIEVSLLTPPRRLEVATREELEASLAPGIDGLLLACGDRSATFLPQVWESVPEPREFVGNLLVKATLPADGWPPGTEAWVYRVEKVGEARAS